LNFYSSLVGAGREKYQRRIYLEAAQPHGDAHEYFPGGMKQEIILKSIGLKVYRM
jgi:hypothetical protein